MRTPFPKLTLVIFLLACSLAAQTAPRPLTQSELLALQAGGALPENIVAAIGTNGVTFKPTESYKALLKRAGARAEIIKALGGARVSQRPSQPPETPQLLEQLTRAAEFMRAKQRQEAAKSLSAAVQSAPGNMAPAFVMGQLLRDQEEWPRGMMVFHQILEADPDFPEAYTKSAYMQYRMGNGEEAIAQARSALRRTPANAEANKNLGLGFETERNFDAAILAYREALRLKPDYASVRYNLGLLYFNKGDLENSIVEYKKAIALEPTFSDAHYNLGVTYERKGQIDDAIKEFREAKRLAPDELDPRLSLAQNLMHNDPAAAIIEFRELETMFPDSPWCHVCFGRAYMQTRDFPSAIEQFKTAARLDPSDSEAHIGLGSALFELKKYDSAMAEYTEAERLDPDSPRAHYGMARVLMERKQYDQAITEWRMVAALDARDAWPHYFMGQTLASKGEIDKAIAEYQESLKLNPRTAALQRVAELFEKKGDYISALEYYRRSAEAWPTRETAAIYEAANARLVEHIAKLKSSGKAAEAAELEKRRAAQTSAAAENIPMQWQASFDAGWKAFGSLRLEEAEKAYKTSLELAEKLQPLDDRVTQSLLQLSTVYVQQRRFSDADANNRRALGVAEQIHGPGSAETIFPLKAIGASFEQQNQPERAAEYYLRALQVAEKFYGSQNFNTIMMLGMLGNMYYNNRQFDKAEPIFRRTFEIEEARVGKENVQLVPLLERMGQLYIALRKLEVADQYYRRSLALQEKASSTDTSRLRITLTDFANLKRAMGAINEAQQLEKQRDALDTRAATTASKP